MTRGSGHIAAIRQGVQFPVARCSVGVAAPVCTARLCEAGARVIKREFA